MSGQDTLIISLADTMGTVKNALPLEGVLELAPKVQNAHPAWYFFYLLVLLGLFAWIRLYYGNIFIQTIQASANFQVASGMFQDNSQLKNQLDNVLYALYFLSIVFLVFLIEEQMKFYPYGFKGGVLYLFNLGLVVGVFMGRLVLVNLTGYLFNKLKIFREYLYNIFIYNKLAGIVILPLLLFVVYTNGVLQEVIFWVTLATLAVVTLMRFIRGLVFSFKKDISLFYMFLYLCALEIVPLALLYRWLEGIL